MNTLKKLQPIGFLSLQIGSHVAACLECKWAAGCPMASVLSERAFNTKGRFVIEKMIHLSSDTVSQLTFTKLNQSRPLQMMLMTTLQYYHHLPQLLPFHHYHLFLPLLDPVIAAGLPLIPDPDTITSFFCCCCPDPLSKKTFLGLPALPSCTAFTVLFWVSCSVKVPHILGNL